MPDALAKRDVHGEIRERIERRLRRDLAIVDLEQHAFKGDDELAAAKLTTRQRRIARAFEEPKKSVPYAIEVAARRVEALIKGQAEKTKTTVNVQNMTIQLPEKAKDAIEAVVIDVESK